LEAAGFEVEEFACFFVGGAAELSVVVDVAKLFRIER
jgi:hypothetical protein